MNKTGYCWHTGVFIFLFTTKVMSWRCKSRTKAQMLILRLSSKTYAFSTPRDILLTLRSSLVTTLLPLCISKLLHWSLLLFFISSQATHFFFQIKHLEFIGAPFRSTISLKIQVEKNFCIYMCIIWGKVHISKCICC